jgi:hypothetical protein
MEDLTEEVKDGTESGEMDESADEDEDEKGEKAENNSCISIYFQSKNHDLKVTLFLILSTIYRQQLTCSS